MVEMFRCFGQINQRVNGCMCLDDIMGVHTEGATDREVDSGKREGWTNRRCAGHELTRSGRHL